MSDGVLLKRLARIREDYDDFVADVRELQWESMIQTGSFLRYLAATRPKAKILELGTGFGFSAAWFLAGMDSRSRLVTVEISPEVQRIAKKHFRREGRMRFVLGDAAAFLRKNKRKFDLVFADAVPGKFEDLQLALDTVAEGGLCVMDDMTPIAAWSPRHKKRVQRLKSALKKNRQFSSFSLNLGTGIALLVRNKVSP